MEKTKFDLTRAMAGEKVVTRDGQFAFFEQNDHSLSYPLCFIIEGEYAWFTIDGVCELRKELPLDLFMASEPKEKPEIESYDDLEADGKCE